MIVLCSQPPLSIASSYRYFYYSRPSAAPCNADAAIRCVCSCNWGGPRFPVSGVRLAVWPSLCILTRIRGLAAVSARICMAISTPSCQRVRTLPAAARVPVGVWSSPSSAAVAGAWQLSTGGIQHAWGVPPSSARGLFPGRWGGARARSGRDRTKMWSNSAQLPSKSERPFRLAPAG